MRLHLNPWRPALLGILVGTAALYVILGARNQWDFETYYYAAATWRSGLDPYDLEALSSIAGRRVDLPFLYPPVTLVLFAPLTFIPIQIAGAAWLGFKSLLVGILIRLWRRTLPGRLPPELVVAATLFGFNLATLWDLRTGNVAVLETFLLWAAFSAYLRDRMVRAALLMVLASVFKLLPIVFLGLLLVPPRSARFRFAVAGGGLAAFLGMLALTPEITGRWVQALAHSVQLERPDMDLNPSAIGLIDLLLAASDLTPSGKVAGGFVLYIAYCTLLGIGSLPALLRMRASSPRVEHIMAMVLLWLLLIPRLMVYSYPMAVPATLYVLQDRLRSRFGRTALVALLLLPGVVRLLPGEAPAGLGVLTFLTLLVTWIIWARARAQCLRPPASPPHTPPGSTRPPLHPAARGRSA